MHDEQLKQLLLKNGRSLTRARRIVFELLLGQEPQTMQVLVSRSKGKIDRASVYRTIELFEQFGIVQRINIGWKYKLELTDLFGDHHHHLHCLNCGGITSLPEDQLLEDRISGLAQRASFKPTTHQLEIQGYCSNCASI